MGLSVEWTWSKETTERSGRRKLKTPKTYQMHGSLISDEQLRTLNRIALSVLAVLVTYRNYPDRASKSDRKFGQLRLFRGPVRQLSGVPQTYTC